MARVGKIKVPVEIYSCERDRWQALNALLSEQLAERAARAHRSLAGVSAEATPDERMENPAARMLLPVDMPPPNPYRDLSVTTREGAKHYAWKMGYAAGLAARDTNEPKEKP